MKNDATLLYYKAYVLRIVDKAVYPVITTVLLGLLVFQINSVLETKKTVEVEQRRVISLEAELLKYKQAAQISDHDRLLYGSILARQIPSEETMFGSLDMVDYFTDITGLELNESSVFRKITESNTQKGAKKQKEASKPLTAKGTLSADELQTFLDTYQYYFPRFLTLESMRVTKQSEQSNAYEVALTLNMYTAPEAETSNAKDSNLTQLTEEDVKTFNMYKSKANVGLYIETSEPLTLDEDSYEVATSPF